MDSKKFSLYGNTITPDQDRKALEWQQMFVDQSDYDPDEQYELSVHDNAYLGDVLATGTTTERTDEGISLGPRS